MAKTNFSGPITTGPIQNNSGPRIGQTVRDVAWVTSKMSFPFSHLNFTVVTDANKLATTAANGAGTTNVTLIDPTQNIPGIASYGGFFAASIITLTSAGNDGTKNAVITGTDVFGNAQTETITMGNAGLVSSALTFLTVTSIVASAGTAGTLEVGVLEAGLITIPARSLFNQIPLGQTVTTLNKNLANNIVIPPFSRITNIELKVLEAFDTAGFDVQIGANVEAAGVTTVDLDYFAGDAANDLKAVGSFTTPATFDQNLVQYTNNLNVSALDAIGSEQDKAICITAATDDALTAGEAVLSIEWLQRINNTN
tara:strand:+ start:178 stop:1110 length:933 start_codon:yes stop_codon:yes gene_type:complete